MGAGGAGVGRTITGGRLSQGERAAQLAELLERGHDIEAALRILRRRAAKLEPRACQANPFGAAADTQQATQGAPSALAAGEERDGSPRSRAGDVPPVPRSSFPPAADRAAPPAEATGVTSPPGGELPGGEPPGGGAARPAAAAKRGAGAAIPDEMAQRMRSRYEVEGLSLEQVGRLFGVAAESVRRRLKALGVAMRPVGVNGRAHLNRGARYRPLPGTAAARVDLDELRRLVASGGESYAAFGARCGVSKNVVAGVAKRMGLARSENTPIRRPAGAETQEAAAEAQNGTAAALNGGAPGSGPRRLGPYIRLFPIGPQPPARTCQFFTGPGLAEADKCGGASVAGESWCATHLARVRAPKVADHG